MKQGVFITFEGCDGSGKSTQAKLLNDYLTERNIPCVLTREPGGKKISEKIRTLLLDPENREMSAPCEALLYAASRVQLLSDIVAPNLSDGKIVICDRYVDSSIAYQSYARGLKKSFVESVNSYALENFLPDLTFFVDLSAKDAFIRKHGVDANDRIEQQGIEFHTKVYEGFVAEAKLHPDRFVVLDGKKDVQGIFEDVLSALKARKIL